MPPAPTTPVAQRETLWESLRATLNSPFAAVFGPASAAPAASTTATTAPAATTATTAQATTTQPLPATTQMRTIDAILECLGWLKIPFWVFLAVFVIYHIGCVLHGRVAFPSITPGAGSQPVYAPTGSTEFQGSFALSSRWIGFAIPRGYHADITGSHGGMTWKTRLNHWYEASVNKDVNFGEDVEYVEIAAQDGTIPEGTITWRAYPGPARAH